MHIPDQQFRGGWQLLLAVKQHLLKFLLCPNIDQNVLLKRSLVYRHAGATITAEKVELLGGNNVLVFMCSVL